MDDLNPQPSTECSECGTPFLAEISPTQAEALLKMGLMGADELGTLAMRWLEEGQDRGSIEVACLALNPPSDVEAACRSFDIALKEMGIASRSGNKQVFICLELYLRALVQGSLPPMTAMAAIDDLYGRRGDASLRNPNRQNDDRRNYLGTELGLEYLYTWYRELQDAESGSPLFYYNDLRRDRQLARFAEELIEEARVLHSHLCRTHPDICAVV